MNFNYIKFYISKLIITSTKEVKNNHRDISQGHFLGPLPNIKLANHNNCN